MLTAERLKELYEYDPLTGQFTHLRSRRGGGLAGPVVARPNSRGYLRLCVDYVQYQQHRLVWLYVHGQWPKQYIDHINGVKTDNRLANLRDVDRAINLANRHRTNANGNAPLLGAFITRSGMYQSAVKFRGQLHYLGLFKTPEEANAAYLAKKAQLIEQEQP